MRSSWRDALSVLRERNFRQLFLARSVSSVGDKIALVALAFAVLEFGDASDLGLVLLAQEVPKVALLLFGGVWADRLSRYRILIASDLTRLLSQGLSAGLVIAGVANTWNLAILAAVYGVGSAFFLPASSSLVPQTVPATQLQQANALLALSRNLMGVTGPAIGAAIVVLASPGWGLAADALTFLAAAIFLVRMRVAEPSRETARPVFTELREGWQEFTSRSWVVAMISSFGFFQLAVFPPLLVLGPVIAADELGGAGAWGAILVCGSIGSILGSLVALRARARRPLLMAQLLSAPFVIQFPLLAMGAPVWSICLAALVGWALIDITDTFWLTSLQQHIPDHALGRISSFDWFGSVALNPAGYAVVGYLAGVVGAADILYAAAILQVLIIVAVIAVPGVRQLGASHPNDETAT